jgi:hypothetical protein
MVPMTALPSSKCLQTCKPISSTKEFHCVVCHTSFYELRAYDIHRQDDSLPEYEDNPGCFYPEDCGLIEEKGMWGYSEDHADRRKIEAKLEKARNAR